MVINTNMSSIIAQGYLNYTQADMQSAMQQLSSGKRINSAADDAAGLAISTRMDSSIEGNAVATRNINDGVSMLQTAESAAGTIVSILQRMRDLAVQADNGTYSSADKTSMDNEAQQLAKEIDHIANSTSFNGISLGTGGVTGTSISFHVSSQSTDSISVTLYGLTTANLGINTNNLTTSATAAIANIDAALSSISAVRANYGAMENRLNFTLQNITVSTQNTQAAQSRIQDADMASAASRMTRDQILSQSALSMLSQANQQSSAVLKLLG